MLAYKRAAVSDDRQGIHYLSTDVPIGGATRLRSVIDATLMRVN